MGHKIVYRTTLGEGQDGDAFEAFMRERYFPAVRKGPTRVGQVLGLQLWRGLADAHESTDTLLVVMDFGGLSTGELYVDDHDVESAFEAFGASLERVGAFSEKGVWPEATAEE
jgi:hypothetical protein